MNRCFSFFKIRDDAGGNVRRLCKNKADKAALLRLRVCLHDADHRLLLLLSPSGNDDECDDLGAIVGLRLRLQEGNPKEDEDVLVSVDMGTGDSSAMSWLLVVAADLR